MAGLGVLVETGHCGPGLQHDARCVAVAVGIFVGVFVADTPSPPSSSFCCWVDGSAVTINANNNTKTMMLEKAKMGIALVDIQILLLLIQLHHVGAIEHHRAKSLVMGALHSRSAECSALLPYRTTTTLVQPDAAAVLVYYAAVVRMLLHAPL